MSRVTRNFATKNAAQCEVETAFNVIVPWARKHFGLSNIWQPNLRTFWDPKIKNSKGGWFAVSNHVKYSRARVSPVLAISVNLCHHDFPVGNFWEYPHYANDSEIGMFFDKWERQLWAVVAHELAHAVEFADFDSRMIDFKPEAKAKNEIWLMMKSGNHGDRFQWIYRELRRAWINNGAWQRREERKETIPLPIPLAVTQRQNFVQNFEHSSRATSMPPMIRVFVGKWASGEFVSGKFETVGVFSGGFRVKTTSGTKDLLVDASNWIAV